MADQQVRLDAVADRELCHRVLDDEDRRELPTHLGQARLDALDLVGLAEHQVAQLEAGALPIQLEASIDVLAKNRLALVEVPRHARVLAPAAREHEHDRGARLGHAVGEDATGVEPLQELDGVLAAIRDHHPPALEIFTRTLQAVGHVGERELGVLLEVAREPIAGGVE